METVFFCKSKKYSFRQDLSSVIKSIIISISLYLFRLFLFFLALCSLFQFAPVWSELQAEFFPHAETMSILILRRWFSFYVLRYSKYSLTGLKRKIQLLRHIQMVLISRIFLSKPLICCSHTRNTKLLLAPLIRQFIAFGSIVAARFLPCADKGCAGRWVWCQNFRQEKSSVTTALYTLSRPARFFYVYHVFNVFYVLLCF